jgi:hypothetical protein
MTTFESIYGDRNRDKPGQIPWNYNLRAALSSMGYSHATDEEIYYNQRELGEIEELGDLGYKISRDAVPMLVYPSSLKSNDVKPQTYIRFEVVDYSSASLKTQRDAFDKITERTQTAIANNRSTEALATIAGSAILGGALTSSAFRGTGAVLGAITGIVINDSQERPDAKPGEKDFSDNLLTDVAESLIDITETNLKFRSVSNPEVIICLPEPDRLTYDYNAKYQDVDLTATQRAADVIKATSALASSGDQTGVLSNTLKEIGISTINDVIKKAGNVLGGELEFEKFVRAQTRMLPNPTQEFLFEGVTRRTFDFQFKMYAKSKAEAMAIFDILRAFKSNMLPSRASDQVNSFYLKYPKLFRIQHRFVDKNGKDSENRYLPQMKLCSLENISVDYTDSGKFSVFDESLLWEYGSSGKVPVGISLALTFKETELLTSEDVPQIGWAH